MNKTNRRRSAGIVSSIESCPALSESPDEHVLLCGQSEVHLFCNYCFIVTIPGLTIVPVSASDFDEFLALRCPPIRGSFFPGVVDIQLNLNVDGVSFADEGK